MSTDDSKTWESFAKAASVEHDSQKLMDLVDQLNGALDKEDRKVNRPFKSAPEE